ncbi:hypothetical protein F2Q70_00028395 [Brassica cretica]|uniref:Uncharacterized protein n=1 Tax=Brassica cretica TaxID=69181 RepID=A0A8S9L4T9_BRACR|nr:hypothetical protein F2Q70_00028395 [Brassica cretica]KAF3577783.1 hypothetical protein DY000_02035307 [Brassica cretica]
MFVIQVDSSFESMVRYGSTVLELVIRFALVPVDFRYQKIIASGFRPMCLYFRSSPTRGHDLA